MAKAKKLIAAKAPKKQARLAGARNYFKQADFPQLPLQQAQKVASAIVDNFAGEGSSPPNIALAMGVSPTSSAWPSLAGSAIAYGLTEGGVNANAIRLTTLGRRLVAPEAEGDDIAARREAILQPRLLKEFFEKYRRAKFPNDAIAANVLKSMGLPADRVTAGLALIKENGRYAGIIRETPTGPFVNLDSPGVPAPAATPQTPEHDAGDEGDGAQAATETAAPSSTANAGRGATTAVAAAILSRVFISHGKQRAVVDQIKDLLVFGNFEPIVSVERETTAISVPEKVFEDMRSCGAGIIHVGSEGKYLDPEGKPHNKLNDNVLIEIGAALALYGKKVILLVERGVSLPTNLQGLYRCEFAGDQLDHDATMKLLKTISQFR